MICKTADIIIIGGGIGSCYSCLVTIDDIPSQRACQTPARAEMVIESEIKTGKHHGNP